MANDGFRSMYNKIMANDGFRSMYNINLCYKDKDQRMKMYLWFVVNID